jgi:tripartite-type tricarboxylate transporter receptor subunit TctC
MKLPRRTFLHLTAGAAVFPTLSLSAKAETYPSRPVTVIVPFAAGGPTDVYSRIATGQMARNLGQQFVVENVPGAGGTIATTRGMRANSDGYTILMGHSGTHVFSVALYPKLAYRPDVDFAPIGLVVETRSIIVARKDFPAKNLLEFIAYAKANPGKLNMAHAGVGSNSFTNGLLFNSLIEINPTMVPFGGTAPATTALVAGQVDYLLTGIVDCAAHIRAGALVAYAIGAAERTPILPDVPTAEEAGLAGFNTANWWGLFAPKDTPQSNLNILSNALDTALDDVKVRKRLFELGCIIPGKGVRGQEALIARVKSDIARWVPIIKAANFKAG